MKKIKGSITVEAALVMPVVFSCIAACIVMCFSLYDKVLSQSVLYEACEYYAENEEGADIGPIREKLSNCILEKAPSLLIKEETGRVSGTVSGESFSFNTDVYHINVKKLMRTVSVFKGEGEEKNENNSK